MRKPCIPSTGRLGRLFVLASALALGHGAALAQVIGAVSVANLRYTVVDLDGTDGIEAAVKLADWPGLPAASGYVYGWHTGVEEPDFYNTKYVTDNANAGGAALTQGSLAAIRSNYSGREAISTVRGDVMATVAPGLAGQNIEARADVAPVNLSFELAPKSSMIVQVDATMLLSAAFVEGITQYARGGARLTVGPTWWPGHYDQVQDSFEGVAGVFLGASHPGEFDFGRTLSVTLVNDSATEWKDGSINFAAGITANIASAVPEAQTSQLMAAGLVVLSVWMRGRRARQVVKA